MVDHKLMESLEYKGEYSVRYTCSQCINYNRKGNYENQCNKLSNNEIKIKGSNNICRYFEPRIKNPSSPIFNFDDYLEFLMSDFYRPYSIDESIILGSAKLGEVILDGGKLAEKVPNIYSPFYKTYDKPFCRIINPLTVVEYGKYKFELSYKEYREQNWLNNGKIKYIRCYWKDTPRERKYKEMFNGEFDIEKGVFT